MCRNPINPVSLFLAFASLSLLSASATGQETLISTIQGADHKSILEGSTVTVTGVVTGLFGKGFFLQSTSPDTDPATAEGLYVFTGNATVDLPQAEIGKVATVTGKLVEFQPFPELPIPRTRKIVECGTTNVKAVPTDDRESFLSITELSNVSALTIGQQAPLPQPTQLNPPGSQTSIGFADKPSTQFNPTEHPRDYFESLEGMRIEITDAIVVSRKEGRWDTFWVAAARNLAGGELSAYGLPIETPNHIFPEIMEVHVAAGQGSLELSPGTKLGGLTGFMSYENGDYMVVLENKIDPSKLNSPAPAVVAGPEARVGVGVASYNALNLYAGSPPEKFAAIATQITNELGGPDLLALQEIQDDDGEVVSELVSAQLTIEKLINAIAAAGGPNYRAVALDPTLPNTDGGAPGGNIRVVLLVRQEKGISVTASERLFDNSERCDPAKNAFASTRKPLLVEMTTDAGTYAIVAVHLSSKLGDQGLYSNAEDPKHNSDAPRRRQAEAIVSELERRYGSNPPRIIVLGDFNDHATANTLDPFRSSALGFKFLRDSRGEGYSVSHEFHGVRGAIDHIVVGGSLNSDSIGLLHYFNVNVDELERTSDHNPVRLVIKK